MLGVTILPADIQDRNGCIPVLKEVRRLFPFLRRIIADGGYQGTDTACAVRQAAGAPLQIVRRSDTANDFVVLPKRWIKTLRRFALTPTSLGGLTLCTLTGFITQQQVQLC